MVRDYELTLIIRSEVEEPDLVAVIDRAKGLIAESGGEVTKLDLWGTRRLAYPINLMRDGQYVFMLTKLLPNAVIRVDRALNLMEDIVRYLFVRVDE